MPETEEHSKNTSLTRFFSTLGSFVLVLIGFYTIILITAKWGAGFSADSAGYLACARNIVNGRGISLIYDSNGNPLSLWLPYRNDGILNLFPWPPFFPIVLSVFGFMKLNLIVAGRFLNALLFGVNIFLISFIVKKYLKSFFLTVFAIIILITSRDMIQIHTMFWSEPLFIFLTLLGFVFLIDFLKNKKILFLLIASLFFSLAFFTRTVGISLIAVCAAAVLFYSELKIKNKIIYSAMSILIGFLPFSLWTLINKFVYGGSQAEFVFNPLTLVQYSKILDTISLWVIANKASEKIRIIIIIALIIIMISMASFIALKNKKRYVDEHYKLNSKIIDIFLFFILFYFIALLSARYFFDEAISIGDSRILLPALISIFIVFLFFLKRFLDFYSKQEGMKILAYIFCGFLIATSLFNNTTVGLYNNGQWYTSNYWYQSETVKELEKMQVQIPIYTNDPTAIYLLLGRNPNHLPIKHNGHTGRENSNYQNDLNKIMEEIKEKDGLIVLFDGGWGDFPNEEKLNKDYKLYLIKDTSDGAIYELKN